MRLINLDTLLLEEVSECDLGSSNAAPYAILSHRWTSQEITYKDYLKGRNLDSIGYSKIFAFCRFVRDYAHPNGCSGCEAGPCSWHRIKYVWIDTVCIDKRSSAELSEAINSMWKWYARAAYCVAYLSDVDSHPPGGNFLPEFQHSQWFARGWTLQELLAPWDVVFCAKDWRPIGRREDPHLLRAISRTTGIGEQCLTGPTSKALQAACIAQKFSWVANRETTRGEDMSYCLLGLLGVNMSLLYGEGGKRAFRRLQFELIARYHDESIFAWHLPSQLNRPYPVLAPYPKHFWNAGNVELIPPSHPNYTRRLPYAVTQRGIQFETTATELRTDIEDLFIASFGERARSLLPTNRSKKITLHVVSLNCSDTSSAADGNRHQCKMVLAEDCYDDPSTDVENMLRYPLTEWPAHWQGPTAYGRFFLAVRA